MFAIMTQEKTRQRLGLELIASENFTSRAVMEVNGSCLTNKYSEGLPGKRYYGGNEFIDQTESLCQKRALEAFRLKDDEWGVNVQVLSGSPANFCVYTALLNPHDRIMGLDLPHGGHLMHGFYTPKKISATSIFFESLPYRLDESKGNIDYDALEANAMLHAQAHHPPERRRTPNYDYAHARHLRQVRRTSCPTWHISGLPPRNVDDPFPCSTSSPPPRTSSARRAAMIFYKKEFEQQINSAVFPGLQGGPHNHTIGALAVALKQAMTPEFVDYQKQVVANCAAMANRLVEHGYELVSGGTDNHLILCDLRPKGIDGARVEKILDLAHITLNKNSVPGDTSALIPGGIRIGAPAMTTRGMLEEDFVKVADLIHKGVEIAIDCKAKAEGPKLKDFNAYLEANARADVAALREEVETYAGDFHMPGGMY